MHIVISNTQINDAHSFLQELEVIMQRYRIKGVTGLALIGDGFMPFECKVPGSLFNPVELQFYNSTYGVIIKACESFGPPSYQST